MKKGFSFQTTHLWTDFLIPLCLLHGTRQLSWGHFQTFYEDATQEPAVQFQQSFHLCNIVWQWLNVNSHSLKYNFLLHTLCNPVTKSHISKLFLLFFDSFFKKSCPGRGLSWEPKYPTCLANDFRPSATKGEHAIGKKSPYRAPLFPDVSAQWFLRLTQCSPSSALEEESAALSTAKK